MKKYIKSNNSARTPKIIDVTPIYTGGNIYIYWGAFSDGTYFIACDDMYDLTIVNADPAMSYNAEEDIFESDYYEWQEDHLVKRIDCNTTQDFYNNMYDWILENKPKGKLCNYSLGDMEERKAMNNNETGGPGDRNRCVD